MMILVNCFIFWTLKNRSRNKGCWHYWGPLTFTMIAVPLIMADLVRHLLQDGGVWPECERAAHEVWPSKCNWSSSQYKCYLTPSDSPNTCVDGKDENMAHLSPMGILFTICFTYLGFVCLFIGTLWNANIVKKLGEIKRKWRELRGTNRTSNV